MAKSKAEDNTEGERTWDTKDITTVISQGLQGSTWMNVQLKMSRVIFAIESATLNERVGQRKIIEDDHQSEWFKARKARSYSSLKDWRRTRLSMRTQWDGLIHAKNVPGRGNPTAWGITWWWRYDRRKTPGTKVPIKITDVKQVYGLIVGQQSQYILLGNSEKHWATQALRYKNYSRPINNFATTVTIFPIHLLGTMKVGLV